MLQERGFLRRFASRSALSKNFEHRSSYKSYPPTNALSFEKNFILGFRVQTYRFVIFLFPVILVKAICIGEGKGDVTRGKSNERQ